MPLSLFDQDEFSDVTIRVGERQFRCHKMILCQKSEYFQALCGPDGKFREADQDTIELKDDDPKAVEVVLRYVYGFEYWELEQVVQDWTVQAHLNTIITATKYLLPAVAETAREDLREWFGRPYMNGGHWKGSDNDLLDAVKFLPAHKESCKLTTRFIEDSFGANLYILFKLREFRLLIETEGWESIRDLCVKRLLQSLASNSYNY